MSPPTRRGWFGSIATRLTAATALLIIALVGVMVWQWAATERRLVRTQKQTEARSFAVAMANAFMNELDDENWGQVRVNAELLLATNPDFVYVLLHAHRHADRIVAGAPAEQNEQYVPDLVPVAVTRGALAAGDPISQESYLLAPVSVGGQRRADRGERIVEVATPIRMASGGVIGTLRVGVSLAAVERAASAAIRKALAIGALALGLGLLGAAAVARRLTRPVRRLADDAAKIAATGPGSTARTRSASSPTPSTT